MILEVSKLKKNYRQPGAEIKVLEEVNLHCEKGDVIAILGQSGSGKSTFLSLLAGLDNPTSGYVQLAGKNLSELAEDELAKFRAQHLGIVFQQFHLMSTLNAEENVSLALELTGRRDDATTKAREILEKVGLGHRTKHFPAELSGGECQRVAIARAVVTQPDVLLADEPSGNLDPKTGEEVMNIIFDLCRDKKITLVLVTHNRLLADKCNRILELKNGILHEVRGKNVAQTQPS